MLFGMPIYVINVAVVPPTIEPGIRPVCDALNAIPGVQTIYSCEGHPNRHGPSTPFVIFLAPQGVAFRLWQIVQDGILSGKLFYSWWLRADFREDGTMQYKIESNDGRLSLPERTKWLGNLRYVPWKRNDMDAEMLRMAGLIAKLECTS